MAARDPIEDDWRLQAQRDFLEGVSLTRLEWVAPRPDWDHDHCAFCWAKFGRGGDQSVGYTTDDRRHWVCDDCFADFVGSFGWKVGSRVEDSSG